MLTIFAIKDPSYKFDWVIYKPPKILKFSKSGKGRANHRDCYNAQRFLFCFVLFSFDLIYGLVINK